MSQCDHDNIESPFCPHCGEAATGTPLLRELTAMMNIQQESAERKRRTIEEAESVDSVCDSVKYRMGRGDNPDDRQRKVDRNKKALATYIRRASALQDAIDIVRRCTFHPKPDGA